MAMFDWVLTIIGAACAAWWMQWNMLIVLMALLFLSIPIHLLFGIHTYSNYYLGLDIKPN
jgi:hypothetical protein